MYAATVTVTSTSTSLRSLINTALSNEVGPLSAISNGRAFQIILTLLTGTASVSSKPGVNEASGAPLPPPNTGATPALLTPVSFTAPTGNQLSIDEMFLASAAGATVGVMVLIM